MSTFPFVAAIKKTVAAALAALFCVCQAPALAATAYAADGGDAAYKGITIDGDFSDWDAVQKYDVEDMDQSGNKKGWDTVDRIAVVWDGDWVYLYFEADGARQDWGGQAGNWNSVTSAGPYNDGKYAITTDLGNQTLVTLRANGNEPYVEGVSTAKAAVNNTDWSGAPHKWEVAIPVNVLGDYKQTIDFGFYQVKPVIKSVANLQGGTGAPDFNGIVYDGKYDDWKGYPHTTIQYATAGTGESMVDSKGALYMEGDKIYGHVSTTMPAHLQSKGQDFTEGVAIKINDDENLMFTPMFAAVDAEGNINWSPKRADLENGTYEFYLFSTASNHSSKNINELTGGDICYGKAKVTINGKEDQMEYYLDVPTLAAHLRGYWGQSEKDTPIDPSSIKTVSAQYGRLGQEWVTTGGTSTTPVIGIAICIAAVVVVFVWRRRKAAKANASADVL